MMISRAPTPWRLLWAGALLWPLAAAAQSLPTAAEVAGRIGLGWNIGNTLEVPPSQGGETGWGNPKVTQRLIDGVKAAGFNAIRIPCAWDGHADANTHQIDPAWLARVKEVVDYCVRDGLYVVLNIHWDGGWLENHVTYADQQGVNLKQKAYWSQIATALKGYDEHLLFAGTNEVHQDYGTPSAENLAVQQSYNQSFVDAVRATGGNNATRPLVVQTYNTNVGHGLSFFTLPRDSAADRLIVEVHFYDPWGFTGEEGAGACLYWGAPYPSQSACGWAQERHVDDQFAMVKAKWVNQGIPVIIGEYGPVKRTSLAGPQLADHLASRQYYVEYVNAAAAKNGLKTFFWDNGVAGLFDRTTGAVADPGAVRAILKGAGVTAAVELTVARLGAGSGTVSSSPSGVSCGATCSASFPSGTSVTLTATPDGGSTFAGWGGACSGTGACTVSMTSARSVTATFSPAGVVTYSLVINTAGRGSGIVSASPIGGACASSCSASIPAGTSVTLTTTAGSDSIFTGWGGACSGTGSCTVSMTADRSVTAAFDPASAPPEGAGVVATGCASGGAGALALPLLAASLAMRVRRRAGSASKGRGAC
jgi:aryl-phospho-beta-D-glucosidase BglC (GH1 family)